MTKPDDSHVDIRTGGASFVGKDAVNLYRAITLRIALVSYAKFKMIMTRGLTATKLLQLATAYTGKPYKRGEHDKAAADMQVWVDTMKAAIPVTRDGVQE